MNKLLIYIFFSAILFYSCNSYKEILYLQDANTDASTKIENYQEITIQPYDMLFIIISSKTPELTLPFNLSPISYSTEGIKNPANRQHLYYTVNKNGYVDMLTLGEIYAEGQTKEQFAELIKNKLIDENYINNPIVTVQPINLNIYITGEVRKPGVYEITKSHITLLEAIAMAGDLTIYGKRNNVKVIREKNGERKIYNIDLRSSELFNSPAYYLQQNDFIYIEPIKTTRKNLQRYK